MSLPYTKAEVVFGSWPLLESQTALGAGSSITGNFFDTVDMLTVRHTNRGFGGAVAGTIYDYNPIAGDPRYVIDYYIYAEGAAGVIAPGRLGVFGRVIDPANPQDTVGIDHTLALVRYSGDVLDYFNNGATFTRNERGVTGTIRLTSRQIRVIYQNEATAQSVFRIGVYLRAI